MKKICAMLLVLGLLLSMVGCGTEKKEEQPKEPTKQSEQEDKKAGNQYGKVKVSSVNLTITPEEFKEWFNQHTNDDIGRISDFTKNDEVKKNSYTSDLNSNITLQLDCNDTNNIASIIVSHENDGENAIFNQVCQEVTSMLSTELNYDEILTEMNADKDGIARKDINGNGRYIYIGKSGDEKSTTSIYIVSSSRNQVAMITMAVPKYEIIRSEEGTRMSGATDISYYVVCDSSLSKMERTNIYKDITKYNDGRKYHVVYFYSNKETAMSDMDTKEYITLISDQDGKFNLQYYDNPEISQDPESENSVNQIVSNETSLNWSAINDNLKSELTDPNYFSFVQDIHVAFDENASQITLTAVVQDSTGYDVVLDFADTFLRRVNLAASIQDSNISMGNKESYGGLYDKYNVMIGIAPSSKVGEQKQWFIYDYIAKGTQTYHKLKLQKAYQ